MTTRRLLVLLLLAWPEMARGAESGLGRIADPAAPVLPLLAANAETASPVASPWAGFYAGSSVFALGGSHHTSAVGGAGTFGYNHAFDNHIVVGIEGTAGLARGSFGRNGLNGFDYAGTNVRVGYDMGRVMPFVFAGVDLVKPTFRNHAGFGNAGDALNDLFTGSAKTRAVTTVGAGVEYAVTNKLTLGFSVSATQARGNGNPGSSGPLGQPLP